MGVSPSTSEQPGGKFLSRDELKSIDNLFLMNRGNESFLLGTSTRRPGSVTLLSPLFILVLGVIIVGYLGLPAVGGSAGNSFTLVTLIIAIPFVVAVAWTFQRYLYDLQFDKEGKLL